MNWVVQLTHTGMVREINEDSLLVSQELGLLAVSDGMGGHRAGDVASRMALVFLERELKRRLREGQSSGQALVDSIKETNRSIYSLATRNQVWEGMGATLTACLQCPDSVLIGQVGDSRAYLIRDGMIDVLTEDHSMVQELVKAGSITAEQALSHPRRNVLTRAIGTGPQLEVDLYSFPTCPKDIFLLCTDGLTAYLLPREILSIIDDSADLDAAGHGLINEALKRGGADNISVILAEF